VAQALVYIDADILRDLCHKLAVRYFTIKGEPVGAHDTCDFAKLDAALANPQHAFAGVDLYPTLQDKAAILCYGLIKAHAFENGNKRISVVALLTFLAINDVFLDVSPKSLEDWAVFLAESHPKDRDDILREFSGYLLEGSRPFDQ
jgi:death-on-curing family protein